MKELRKKNNKGFTLVELIVVVLIIGILGVALAPNIMKWVNNARTNSDKNNRASVEASVNAAVADFLSDQGNYIGAAIRFNIQGGDPTTINTETTSWDTGQQAKFMNYVKEVFNKTYPNTQEHPGGFTVLVTIDGSVTVTYSPTPTPAMPTPTPTPG